VFEIIHEDLLGGQITALGYYRPWGHHVEAHGGSEYPEHSKRVLDLKDRLARGIDHFFDYLSPRIKRAEAIAYVPSSDAEKLETGIRDLASKLAQHLGLSDATRCIVRHTTVEKAALGGLRAVEVHQGSLRIESPHLIQGRAVLLLDDVMSTGNSLTVCRQLLLDAGASEVKCIALGRTRKD
jgi:predicted amidophosphoribosyltransferase